MRIHSVGEIGSIGLWVEAGTQAHHTPENTGRTATASNAGELIERMPDLGIRCVSSADNLPRGVRNTPATTPH
jgi:hypothetical protein